MEQATFLKDKSLLTEDTQVSGLVLIKSGTKKKTTIDKPFYTGDLSTSDGTIGYKVWENSAVFPMFSQIITTTGDLSNVAFNIMGKVDMYGGKPSIIITGGEVVAEVDETAFLPRRYDAQDMVNKLFTLTQLNLSEKGNNLLNTMLWQNPDIFKKFTEEFAAKGHHDNCLSGLIAHTQKVVKIMVDTINTYPEILNLRDMSTEEAKDLYIIGATLHDIGKIQEMHYGEYQPSSVVTHRILGLDYLYDNRQLITETYSEKWFRHFQSVIVQHHDEWEDKARTVVAYVVSLCDVFDARLTGLEQHMREDSYDTSTGTVVFAEKDKPLNL